MIVSLMALHMMAAAAGVPALPANAPQVSAVAPQLAPGTRVRVKAQEQKWVGRIVEADETRLRLLPDDGGPAIAMRQSDIRRLEVSRGRGTMGESAMQGATIGVMAGFAMGALLGASVGSSAPWCLAACHAGENAVFLGLAGATVAGVVGAVAGAAYPRERWVRIETVRAHVLLQPRRHGMGAALALRF